MTEGPFPVWPGRAPPLWQSCDRERTREALGTCVRCCPPVRARRMRLDRREARRDPHTDLVRRSGPRRHGRARAYVHGAGQRCVRDPGPAAPGGRQRTPRDARTPAAGQGHVDRPAEPRLRLHRRVRRRTVPRAAARGAQGHVQQGHRPGRAGRRDVRRTARRRAVVVRPAAALVSRQGRRAGRPRHDQADQLGRPRRRRRAARRDDPDGRRRRHAAWPNGSTRWSPAPAASSSTARDVTPRSASTPTPAGPRRRSSGSISTPIAGPGRRRMPSRSSPRPTADSCSPPARSSPIPMSRPWRPTWRGRPIRR